MISAPITRKQFLAWRRAEWNYHWSRMKRRLFLLRVYA